MENEKIIKLNLSTKILYSLFNFFAPIAFITILTNSLGLSGGKNFLFTLLSIFIGFACLFLNLAKYNRYLYINENNVAICKGKINNPKVIKIIKIENAISEKLNNNLTIKYENKKIELLNTSFSIVGTICFIGPLLLILIAKNTNTLSHISHKIYQKLPMLFDEEPKKPNRANDFITNFTTWLLVLFISFIGLVGLYMFYLKITLLMIMLNN